MSDGSYCMECGCITLHCTCGGEVEWNLGYYFEAMDRLHVVMSGISDHINEHPGIIKSGGQKDIDKALYHLMEAYQKVGAADYEQD